MNEVVLRRPMFGNPRVQKVREAKRPEKLKPMPGGKPRPT